MNNEKMLFYLDGLRCASCVNKLEQLPNINPQIKSSRVYFADSLLEMETKLATKEAIANIENLGFGARLIESQNQIFEEKKKSNRDFLSKIGVTAFSAGNIMLLSVANYAGADGYYKVVFSYLSFLLFLPIVLYATSDFYKNAWRALKQKSLSIDLPISVALITGFLLSTWNLIWGNIDLIYYDSIATFMLLILSARYLLHRLQQHYIATYSDNDFLINDTYKVDSIKQPITKEDLIAGQVLLLERGQILPTEAELLSEISEWDTSIMSGESYPKTYHQKVLIPSGSKLISTSAKLKIKCKYRNSRLYQVQKKLEDLKTAKTSFTQYMDRFSNYFISSVFIVSAIFFMVYSFIDLAEAFQRTLALLIVACPCAIALGTPMAYLIGAYKAKKAKILIFNQEIFDRLLEVKHIFFDKTGTLTKGHVELKYVSNEDPELLNLILNLEKNSEHPIANAIRKKYSHLFKDLEIQPKEIKGMGVEGTYNGNTYQFTKNTSSNLTSSELKVIEKDRKKLLLNAEFSDSLFDNTKEEIAKLKDLGLSVNLASGDKSSECNRIANELNISNIYSEMSPEDKLKLVESTPYSLMVGDGVNDILALQRAHASISVKGSVSISVLSSQSYLVKKGISQILEIFHLAKEVRKTVISNLSISLIYNVLAGFFALAGYINPLVAAILMPISSVVIILNSVRGIR